VHCARDGFATLNFGPKRPRGREFKASDNLSLVVRKKLNSAVFDVQMEIDKSWNAFRAIWEDPAGRYSHSYGPVLATPPLSPLDPPKQGIRNGVESDKDSHEPCTPSSDTFDSPRTQTHKGVHRTAKIASMDLFTALNSPWPSPLFSGRTTTSYHKLQRSRSTDFDDTRISSTNYSDRKTDESYQEMGQAICIRIRRILHRRSESRLALSIPDEKKYKYSPASTDEEAPEPSDSNSVSDRVPRRRRRIPRPFTAPAHAPSPLGPFILPFRVHPRKELSPSALEEHMNINRDLLRCVCLLENSRLDCLDLAEDALEFAENALAMAEEAGYLDLATKAQFYRGQCLILLERFKEASDAFTKAATIRDFKNEVAEWKNIAETMGRTQARHKGNRMTVLRQDFWNDNDR
jgi:tetratricopeptide (TPR) repeat protein